jgi:hypothetical protein
MREAGAILVPTRTIVDDIRTSRAAPPYAQAKLDAIADIHRGAVALAHEAGVRVAMGTDLALRAGGGPGAWGRNGRELPLLGECGFTALEAIEAATFGTAPSWVRRGCHHARREPNRRSIRLCKDRTHHRRMAFRAARQGLTEVTGHRQVTSAHADDPHRRRPWRASAATRSAGEGKL